jgi:hypothetical protein
MPTPTIPAGNLFMNATLYTGTGSALSVANGVAGQAFQPDFVWIKQRSGAQSHCLYDSVRGATKQLNSNNAGAEGTYAGVSSFNTNGFSIGTADNNTNGATYVGWNWKAGGTAVTNTAGSITSQVSANTTSGFSVITYTGNGTTGATVGHGLGVAPQFIMIKQTNAADSWNCYHVSIGNGAAIFLNQSATPTTASSFWNNTTPSSTVITFGNAGTNQNNNVAYCFAPIAGYSAFGSYTGNGSADGPFVYLGFRPRFIMFKCTSTTENWVIIDSSRDTYNVGVNRIYPNTSGADDAGANVLDILSNGFKQRNSAASGNISGQTYVYACWAENPFKYANAR